jgi:hypothetical protein
MNIMTPSEEITPPEPTSEQPSTGEKKTNSFSRLIKSVSSRKRRVNVLRSSSFHSQGTAATEALDDSNKSADSSKVVEERNVRFSTEPVFHFTLSRKDYTPEEIRASWFEREEYRKITKECCKQIKKMESGEVLKDKEYCSRGLESHTRLAAISKTRNRETAINAVLDEQEDQREMVGDVDEEDIAQRYQQTTSSCQLWASSVGLRDQRAAEEYMD